MKILIVGASGTIGQYLSQYFSEEHEVISSSRKHPDNPIDIEEPSSIEALFKKIGKVDAIICAAGEAPWDTYTNLTEADFYVGIKSKLMGQINLSRIGLNYLNDSGSITLTTGILADDPVVKTTIAAMVNGGIHSFVKAMSLEMPMGKRINVVSSGVVENAYEKYKSYFPGHPPISMEKMTLGYVRSLAGKGNGQVIRIYN